MDKGIIIVAIGHSNYYRMAENLAASIKVNASEPITILLVCDNSEKIRYQGLFQLVREVPEDMYTRSGKVVFNKLMLELYELSPFDTTIKLDADMIWLPGRDPLNLFSSLDHVDITFMNRGHGKLEKGSGYSVWAEEEDIRKAYKLVEDPKCYKIYGEFLYFKKNRQNARFFARAKDIYTKAKVKCRDFSNDGFTDELAYQITCMQLGVYPHQENFTPIFNKYLDYPAYLWQYAYQLPQQFFAYSIGGNSTSKWMKTQYDILANSYFRKLGLQNPYTVEDKRAFLPERKKA